MKLHYLLATVALGLLAGLSQAQSADECVNATPISGSGVFPFDQTAATKSADDPQCGIHNDDIWYSWTAGSSNEVSITTCGLTAVDTVIAAWDSCGGSLLACNDQDCGNQSSITFDAIEGEDYLIQVASWNDNPGGTGSLRIIEVDPTFNPSNGHYYQWFAGPSNWNTAGQLAANKVFKGIPGHLVTLTSQEEIDWYIQNVPGGGSARPFIGLYQDTNAPDYSEPSGGWKWVTGEPFSYANWNIGEPNNSGGENYAELSLSGRYNDVTLTHGLSTAYVVEWDVPLEGTLFCDPPNANSTGLSTRLIASVDLSTGTGWKLDGYQGPAGQFGFFLIGTTVSEPGMTVSQGVFCLSGAFGRYNFSGTPLNSIGQFDASGRLLNLSNTASNGLGFDIPFGVPLPGNPTIMPGQTWNFQLWHRESGGVANFSNGVSLTF